MPVHPVLLAGQWRRASSTETFHAENPANSERLPDEYPISNWSDLDSALAAAATAAGQLRQIGAEKLSGFLSRFAQRLEGRAGELVEAAHQETALPASPRLKDIELPRMATQLRQAAAAAAEGSWSLPTIDTKLNIRSYHAPVGPVFVLGPNNFPFAFNAVSGGDFAAAIAAGNPVIAKGHPSHPTTTRLLAEEAFAALTESGLPAGTIQVVYHIRPEDGLRMVGDARLAAVAFTGSRGAGMKIKAAADAAGKPAYLEMSSLNPVVILPGALKERLAKIADEFADSALAANGQFCTNPGITILLEGPECEAFIGAVKERFEARKPSSLLSAGVCTSLEANMQVLVGAGAKALTPREPAKLAGNVHANTLLKVNGADFLENSHGLQTEAFGNVSLLVIARDAGQAEQILSALEGQLTGCIYSATTGGDDGLYAELAPLLRPKVGRLLNDKMPTGVALSPAMNHGGPYPATGHPGFTAVGIPGSLRRFSMLQCFDGVRAARLPAILGNKNPSGKAWRMVDGHWTQGDLG